MKNIKKYASLGGKKRKENLSAKERSIIASKAANARWKAYRERQSHVCGPFCECKICGKYEHKGPHSKHSIGYHEFVCIDKD
jgi:hypothetical protein